MKDNTKKIYDYSAAILKVVEKELLTAWDDLSNPCDKIIHPLCSLLFDATIITLAHADVSNISVASNVNGPDIMNIAPMIRHSSLIYQDALDRMNDRVGKLQYTESDFCENNDQRKVEVMASLNTVLVPRAFIKAFKAGITLHHLGAPYAPMFKPSQLWMHETIVHHKFLASSKPYAFDGLTEGVKNLMYVILNDGVLRIASTKLPNPALGKDINESGKFDFYMSGVVGPRDVAALRKVHMAGEIKVFNGKITQINNEFVCYTADVLNPEKYIRKTFVKNGYSDAANASITRITRITSSYDPDFKPTNIGQDNIAKTV